MSFFLLGKSADERFYLVSDSAFESRAAALKELSAITAAPSFDGWDDEILVVDESSGSPVLLVRPAGTVEAESDAADESLEDADAVEAAEPVEDALRGALLRSTMQMEAQGIVAPESVGQATAEEESAPASWPWDKPEEEDAPFELSALEEPGDDDGSLVRAAGDDATMAASRPVIMGAYAEPSDEPQADESAAQDDADDADDADDDADDADDAVDADDADDSGEPEAVEPAAASVMEPESQAEEAPESVPGSMPLDEAPAIDPASDFVDLSIATPEDVGTSAPDAPDPATAIDDVAPDDPAEPASELPVEASSEPVESPGVDQGAVAQTADEPVQPLEPGDASDEQLTPIDAMTCNDCVYVETCPNRGQLAPESCGSFQWK